MANGNPEDLWNLIRAKLKVPGHRLDWAYYEDPTEDFSQLGPQRRGTIMLHFNGGSESLVKVMGKPIVAVEDAQKALDEYKELAEFWEAKARAYEKLLDNHFERVKAIDEKLDKKLKDKTK